MNDSISSKENIENFRVLNSFYKNALFKTKRTMKSTDVISAEEILDDIEDQVVEMCVTQFGVEFSTGYERVNDIVGSGKQKFAKDDSTTNKLSDHAKSILIEINEAVVNQCIVL